MKEVTALKNKKRIWWPKTASTSPVILNQDLTWLFWKVFIMLKRHTCISEDTCHVSSDHKHTNSGVLTVNRRNGAAFGHACLSYFITPLLANPGRTRIDKIRWAPQMIIRLRNCVQHPKETNTRILKSHAPAQEPLQWWQKTCWPSPSALQGKQCSVRG